MAISISESPTGIVLASSPAVASEVVERGETSAEHARVSEYHWLSPPNLL